MHSRSDPPLRSPQAQSSGRLIRSAGTHPTLRGGDDLGLRPHERAGSPLHLASAPGSGVDRRPLKLGRRCQGWSAAACVRAVQGARRRACLPNEVAVGNLSRRRCNPHTVDSRFAGLGRPTRARMGQPRGGGIAASGRSLSRVLADAWPMGRRSRTAHRQCCLRRSYGVVSLPLGRRPARAS